MGRQLRVIAGLYFPNGNPGAGPKFKYKLRWFERLHDHFEGLVALNAPIVISGDLNVMPTDLSVYAPDRWRDDALFASEVRAAYARLLGEGWTDALRGATPS